MPTKVFGGWEHSTPAWVRDKPGPVVSGRSVGETGDGNDHEASIGVRIRK